MLGEDKANNAAKPEKSDPTNEKQGLSRRVLLTRAGKLAWAAPALVVLNIPGNPANASNCGPDVPAKFCPPGPSLTGS